jgi:hypothetical protein
MNDTAFGLKFDTKNKNDARGSGSADGKGPGSYDAFAKGQADGFPFIGPQLSLSLLLPKKPADADVAAIVVAIAIAFTNVFILYSPCYN